MAVRDDQQLKEPRRGLPWRETLSQAPAVALVGGLLVYGYMRLYLQRFYGGLGVDPNDVGLTYADTLARSIGFLIYCSVVLAYTLVAALTLKTISRLIWRIHPATKHRRTYVPPGALLTVGVPVIVTVSLIVASLWVVLDRAEHAARRVQAGRQLPRSGLLGASVIRADLATVEPAGKRGESPAAERLQGRRLLYLGQSGGTVVLYDAAIQRAIYVPASSIVLQVANCSTKPPPDAACG